MLAFLSSMGFDHALASTAAPKQVRRLSLKRCLWLTRVFSCSGGHYCILVSWQTSAAVLYVGSSKSDRCEAAQAAMTLSTLCAHARHAAAGQAVSQHHIWQRTTHGSLQSHTAAAQKGGAGMFRCWDACAGSMCASLLDSPVSMTIVDGSKQTASNPGNSSDQISASYGDDRRFLAA